MNVETVNIGSSEVKSSRLVYGCMRVTGDGSPTALEKGKAAILRAFENGFTHFDHADIYGGGRCEVLFSEVLRDVPGMRDDITITSKCGIRGTGDPGPDDPARYDFRKEYILKSVDGSLGRLGIDSLDILLLHRPDYLFSPDEVASAFEDLSTAGKVRHFGVSNFHPSQVSMLQKYCDMPLLMNQVEINIHNIDALLDGTLDQCLELGISPQAWCPLGGVVYPAWGNTFDQDDAKRITGEFERQSRKYEAEPWIIMLAWLLLHPATILPIIGTTTPSRVEESLKALGIPYTREDWYRLLEARNGRRVP
jgi:predicted oxidoreductase